MSLASGGLEAGFPGAGDAQAGGDLVPQPENQDKKQPPQQFAKVASGSGQHGVDRVPMKTSQKAAAQPVVLFQMADFRFDRTPALASFLHRATQLTTRTACDVNGR